MAPKVLDASVGMRRRPVRYNRTIVAAQNGGSEVYASVSRPDHITSNLLEQGLESVVRIGLARTLERLGQRGRKTKTQRAVEPSQRESDAIRLSNAVVSAQYALVNAYDRLLAAVPKKERAALYKELAGHFDKHLNDILKGYNL